MTSSETMDDYLARIERHFGLRRGGRLLLSPKDWQQVREWHERGVPLPVVLRGINRAFDRFEAAPRPDRINSLSYCAQQVEEVWEQERERSALEGARSDDGRAIEGPAGHLRAVAEACRRAAEQDGDADGAGNLREVATQLDQLAARLADGELGAREVDARALELEGAVREGHAELFEPADGPPTDGHRATLPPFSPWSL